MTRLGGRVTRLERADGECRSCGWPENGITLEIVEVVVTGTAEEIHAAMEKEAREPHWLQPCQECGRIPPVVEVVRIDSTIPDGAPDIEVVDGSLGGIPQRR
jgi:hypothetical protein